MQAIQCKHPRKLAQRLEDADFIQTRIKHKLKSLPNRETAHNSPSAPTKLAQELHGKVGDEDGVCDEGIDVTSKAYT